MNYGIFMLIISYQLANNPRVNNMLHVRDLETLSSICSTEDKEQVIDLNKIFTSFKKRTGLRVSNDTLYNYFRGLGVKFYQEV